MATTAATMTIRRRRAATPAAGRVGILSPQYLQNVPAGSLSLRHLTHFIFDSPSLDLASVTDSV